MLTITLLVCTYTVFNILRQYQGLNGLASVFNKLIPRLADQMAPFKINHNDCT